MSPIDRAQVKRATPGVKTILAPNGVDVEFFHIDDTIERDNHTAVYMGDYKYFPNTDAVLYFIREILPHVRHERPNFELVLLGKDAPPELMALDANPDSGVRVVGLVPDTRPYLQGSAMFVCPLRSGSGTRFKLLESLACGCPVVSTTIGAEGLNAVDGEHMLLRDDPREFAQAILALLDDPARGAEIGRAGRQWVVNRHAWAHSATLLSHAYDQLIGHEAPTLRMSAIDIDRLSQEWDDRF